MHQRVMTLLMMVFVVCVVSLLPSVYSALDTAKNTLINTNEAISQVELTLQSVQALADEASATMDGMDATLKKVYDIVLNSQLAGLDAVKAGVKCFDVDKVCRDIITEAGYGEYYIHGTGHGVGTEVHEPPTLNSRSDEILQENQAVTVEPGIYLPEKFCVRIEDLAIVTSFGIINCTRSTKELIVL